MAPIKRPAATAAAGRGKSAKQDPAAVELNAIRAELSEAEAYPQRVREMLAAGLDASLCARRDVRHSFQEQVVGMVGEVLASLREARQRSRDAFAERITASDAERARREGRVEAARAGVEATTGAVEAAKAALSEASGGVAEAKAAAAAAKAAQRLGDASLLAAFSKKSQLEALRDGDYAALKRGDAPNPAKVAKAMAKVCWHFGMEAQLLDSAQLALSKPASERGGFDSMVLEQLEGELGARLAAFDAELESGEGGRAERASAVEAEERELAAATERLLAGKAGLQAAQASRGEAEDELKAAEAAMRDLAPELRQLEADLAQADHRLQATDAVLGSFARLRDRTSADEAPAEPPAAAAAEPPAAPEPMTEPQATSA